MGDEDWTRVWLEGDVPIGPMIRDWLQRRPPETQLAMLKFPPSCLVRRSDGALIRCADSGIVGEIAIVSAYDSDGDLLLRSDPGSTSFHKHPPEGLEVVGYWRGLTPEKVRAALTDDY